VNPQSLIAALPWVRRIWKVLPPQARVPVLLVVAGVGIWQFVSGRSSDGDAQPSAAADGPPAAPRS
jgi:hypothetical protein